MRTIGFLIAILLFQNCSNKTYSKQTNDNSNNNDELYYEIAINHIENTLADKVVFEKSISQNGDWEITFSDDTTNTELEDTIKELYNLERGSLVKGDLNNDNLEDFAIRNVWRPEMGNSFELTWYIFISSADKWIPLDNKFGGGKFTDIEDVISIRNGKIETSLQKLEEGTFFHSDSSIIKFYSVKNDVIILIE